MSNQQIGRKINWINRKMSIIKVGFLIGMACIEAIYKLYS